MASKGTQKESLIYIYFFWGAQLKKTRVCCLPFGIFVFSPGPPSPPQPPSPMPSPQDGDQEAPWSSEIEQRLLCPEVDGTTERRNDGTRAKASGWDGWGRGGGGLGGAWVWRRPWVGWLGGGWGGGGRGGWQVFLLPFWNSGQKWLGVQTSVLFVSTSFLTRRIRTREAKQRNFQVVWVSNQRRQLSTSQSSPLWKQLGFLGCSVKGEWSSSPRTATMDQSTHI